MDSVPSASQSTSLGEQDRKKNCMYKLKFHYFWYSGMYVFNELHCMDFSLSFFFFFKLTKVVSSPKVRLIRTQKYFEF